MINANAVDKNNKIIFKSISVLFFSFASSGVVTDFKLLEAIRKRFLRLFWTEVDKIHRLDVQPVS